LTKAECGEGSEGWKEFSTTGAREKDSTVGPLILLVGEEYNADRFKFISGM